MEERQEKEEREKKEELDTQTTVADMNVEGFSWYDPAKKKNPSRETPKLTKKEQKALIRGAYKAMLPMIGCMVAVGLFMFLLVFLWLK